MVAIIFCELECCVDSAAPWIALIMPYICPFTWFRGLEGAWLLQLFQVSFTPWAGNTTTLSHCNKRAGHSRHSHSWRQWAARPVFKAIHPTCAQFMQAMYISFICSKVLPFGRCRADDLLDSRALPSDRLQARCLCEVTVSGISFRGYHRLSCCCKLNHLLLLVVAWAFSFGI